MPLAGWTIAFQVIRLAAQGHFEHVEVRGVAPGPAAIAMGSASRATLDAAALEILGPDQGRWMMLARRSAGDPVGSPALERNGLGIGGISTDADAITIGVDPFGIERAGAGTFAVEIQDRLPRTRWDISARPGTFTTDRSDPTLADATRSTRARSLAASGPLGAGIFFSASANATRTRANPVYVSGLGPDEALAASVDQISNAHDWRARLTGGPGRVRWTSGLSFDRLRDDAAGLGGEIGPSGAVRLDARSTSADAGWKINSAAWRLRAAARLTASTRDIAATGGRGLQFAGRLISGGPDAVTTSSRDRSAAFMSVLEAAGPAPAWLVGVSLDSESRDERRVWNPDGQQLIAAPDDTRRVLFTRNGATSSSQTDRNAAVFGQAVVVNRARVWIRAGLRADIENGFRATWAPRLSAGFAAGSWLIGANAGVFANRFGVDQRVELAMRSAAPMTIAGDDARLLVTEGAPTRRRDVVVRGSAARRLGPLGVTLEETATFGRHLGGLIREREAFRLIDRVDANGALDRFESHLRIDAGGRAWSLTAHAQHTHSIDDTDGLFSLPATPLGRAGERGPSSGVSTWSTSLVGQSSFRGVRLLLSSRFATGTPYSLLSGLDSSTLLAFNGRASSTRNAERLPAIRDVSLYLMRRVLIPHTPIAANAGLRFENIAGALLPTGVVRTANSPLAGHAAGAAAGRSMSVWLTFGRR